MSTVQMPTYGPLAFVGGGEWQSGTSFDSELLACSDGEVCVLPTAAAFEHPERAVAQAVSYFASLGGRVRPVMVLNRKDAEDPLFADAVQSARFIYLCGGSPLHLRSVLKDSSVLNGLISAWSNGAVVAGSSAGAMVLTDPMVDPRGGAFTVGFGLIRGVAIIPHFSGELTLQIRRTVALAPSTCVVVALGEQCALIRAPDGTWRDSGRKRALCYVAGKPASLEALLDKPVWTKPS
jgi:cyanophycinase